MKIQVTIEAESVKEYQQVLEELRGAQSAVTELTVDAAEIAKRVAAPHAGPAKKSASKKKAAPKKEEIKKEEIKKEEVSTDSTSDTEPSKTGEVQEPTDKEPQKSATANMHPGATKADVQALMRKALAAGHRDAVQTAFQRNNATSLGKLAEEDYGVFMTDLEAMIEAGGK